MAAKSFYPNLSTIVTVEAFPEELQFIENGLQNALDNIYFKELQYVKSTDTSQGYYNLILVTGEALKLDIGASGFSLVINPGATGETIVPLTINYNWPVLALINNFNIDNFSFLPEEVQDLLYTSLTLNDTDLIISSIDTFEGNTSFSSFQSFVDKINTFYSLTGSSQIGYPSDADELNMAEDIRWSIFNSSSISDDILTVVNSVYIISNDSNEYANNLSRFSQNITGDTIEEYISKIIIPKIEASLDLSIGLAFPRNILVPLTAIGGEPIPEPEQSTLIFDAGTLQFSTQGGIGFDEEMSVTLNHPSQIGNTGLGIDIVGVKLDLSTSSNIPEADLDGRPQDFIGVYAQKVGVTLPSKWFNSVETTTLEIAGYNLLIGTGGVSGTIALETVDGNPNDGNDYLNLQIGNWIVGFNHFDLSFHQNAITESNVAGLLTIPKLKDSTGAIAQIEINGHLNEQGDFNLTASEPDGIHFSFFDFINFNLLSVELGRENDDFYIGTSCQIWFNNPTMDKILGGQKIEIPRIRIYDNGSIEIVGGNGFIPVNVSLNLGPIDVAVTGVHYGSTQSRDSLGRMRRYNYWGFDGAISLDPLAIDIRGEGIKYYYTTDNEDMAAEFGGTPESYNEDFIRVQTIEVDLIIPGTAAPDKALAIIHGMLSIPEPGISAEYAAEVSVKLPQARIAGSAAMKLQPRYPAFIIEAGFEIPTPIPLGATGLGFYGFGGLIGYRYVASKEKIGLSADDSWYDYFKHPELGVNIDKFANPSEFEDNDYSNAFSIGAGTVLATLFDDGKLFSTRLMAILSLPQVFILDGRANVLGKRLGMLDNNEPPFFAFVAISDQSIEFGFGADYQLKNNGYILDLYAEVQAGFFFNNSSAWYVNFGTRNNPITATLFKSLLNLRAQAYLMLSAQGIEAGARIDFDLRKRFGPFKVHIYAYLEVGGYISFERPQLGGYIAAGGGIDIDVWIIGISLSFDAILSAEASDPFLIYAEVRFRACAKVLFVKVCKSFTVKLKWEKNKNVNRDPVPPLPDNKTEELVKGIHMLTNEAFDIQYLGNLPAPPSNDSQIDAIIPLDTYIEFKTEKGLVPSGVSGTGKVIGGYTFAPENHVDLIPPQKVVRGGIELRQVKHKYSIEEIEVKAWNGTTWVDYHPYKAAVKAGTPEQLEELRNIVNDFKFGYWQIKGKQYDTIRLLASTSFTYMDAGEPGWVIPEQYGITPSTLFCSEEIRVEDCSNVLNKPLGTKYYPPTQYVGHFINGAYYTLANVSGYEIIDGNIIVVENEYMEVTNAENVHGFEKSLSFNNYNRMVIILPEASVTAKFKLTTDSQGATLKFYKSVINDLTSVVEYVLVEEQYKLASSFDLEIEYTNEDNPFTKIEIIPDDPDIQAILDLLEQIAELFEITYDQATGEIIVSEPTNVALYNQLLAQLEALKAEACSEKKDGIENGNGCEQDPVICPLYDRLLKLFTDCFVPIQTSEQVDEHIGCFIEFETILAELNVILQDGPFTLEYENYVDILDQMEGLIGHHEQILRFQNLMASAQALLDIVFALGNCGCDPKPEDKCDTSLQEICWVTLENHEWNETIPGSDAVQEEYDLMVAGLERTIQPVWRPNTSYYIKYKLKDEVDNGDSDPGIYNHYYGFKTVGPLGHFHKDANVDYIPTNGTADEYPITSLRSYIDYNRSYPNADGNILKAKPIFYGHEQFSLSLFFNKPFAQNLLDKWHEYEGMPELDGSLHIAIKDPVSNVIIPYPLPVDYDEETVPVISGDDGGWTGDDDPLLPPHIQTIINMIDNGEIPCNIILGDQIVPANTFYNAVFTNLKPQKIYTALFYNAFEVTLGNVVSEPVHEYVFQTSRYENFEAQVKSYLLEEADTIEHQAVYDLPITVSSADISKAFQIISLPEDQIGDELESDYQHLFDRVIEGVLGIKPLDPPTRTEFHKIINTDTGKILAILIRNPEPFNIPKIPLEVAQDSIEVTFANGNPHGSYKLLHSKDYSQAIAMRGSGNITAPKMHFKFHYLKWNGSIYEAVETVTAGDIIINE